MALHVDENGVGAVTPVYLTHPSGYVPHPLQLSGQLPHLPSPAGLFQMVSGHPWHGGTDRTVQKI